jgi:hypothetical protein
MVLHSYGGEHKGDVWEGIEEIIRRKIIQRLDARMSGGDLII